MAKPVGRPKTREYALAYRVVKACGLDFKSPFISNHATVKFKVNEWAKPKKGCGPLCCFKTFKAAKAFLDRYVPSAIIFQALIKKSELGEVWTSMFNRSHLSHLTTGKVLADKVMLLSIVHDPYKSHKTAVTTYRLQQRAKRLLAAKAAKKKSR